jgi:hypothetical protein
MCSFRSEYDGTAGSYCVRMCSAWLSFGTSAIHSPKIPESAFRRIPTRQNGGFLVHMRENCLEDSRFPFHALVDHHWRKKSSNQTIINIITMTQNEQSSPTLCRQHLTGLARVTTTQPVPAGDTCGHVYTSYSWHMTVRVRA